MVGGMLGGMLEVLVELAERREVEKEGVFRRF